MTYSEKLKDPRWQKKRLEILQRDEFACVRCGNSKLTLHVHHKSYIPDQDPWDYEDDNYETLCFVCHDVEHQTPEQKEQYKQWFKDYMLQVLERAFDSSRLESSFLPYGLFTDAVMELCALTLYYDGNEDGARRRLRAIIESLSEKIGD